MAYSQSKIKLYRRCQRQYAFRHETVPGLELVPRIPKVQLYRGSWMHALQEALHKQWAGLPANWQDVHEEWTNKFLGLFDEERAELGDLPGECERLFRSYLRFWRDDQDRYRVTQLSSGEPAIEVLVSASLVRWNLTGGPFKGRIDLVVQDQEYGGNWIWDAKWVKNLPHPDERMMSPQSLMYPWAFTKQYKIPISGFLYNYGRTKAPTRPNVLKSTGLLTTRASLDSEYYTYIHAIKEHHGDQWKRFAKTVYATKLRELKARDGLWFKRERIPVDKDRVRRGLTEFLVSARQIEARTPTDIAHPPRSYFYNCRWGCDYHGPCVAEFTGLDISGILKSQYTTTEERYGATDDLLAG